MDSQPPTDGFLLDVVDDEWRQEVLPFDRIEVPAQLLPDPEADNGDPTITVNEQEQRWTDLALSSLTNEMALNDQSNTGA